MVSFIHESIRNDNTPPIDNPPKIQQNTPLPTTQGASMKTTLIISAFIALTSNQVLAAKTYQVTGTVLAVTDSTITVDKKGEKFEIEKTAATKVTGELKQGSKVTVLYSMSAAEVEVKAETAAKKAKK
jgi:hypothetical protein